MAMQTGCAALCYESGFEQDDKLMGGSLRALRLFDCSSMYPRPIASNVSGLQRVRLCAFRSLDAANRRIDQRWDQETLRKQVVCSV
jgi:hypothetical protein